MTPGGRVIRDSEDFLKFFLGSGRIRGESVTPPCENERMFDSATLTEIGGKPAGFAGDMDTSAVKATVQDLARVDVRCCAESELLQAATDLAEIISFAQTAHAHVLGRLDALGSTDVHYGMRTASWVASQSGTARGPIVGRLRVGRALRDHFDRIDEAVSSGGLSFDHAKALCDSANPRITDALAGVQDEILGLADGATFEQYKRDVAALAELVDTDGAEPDVAVNRLSMPVTIDDTVKLEGTLDRANGLTLRTAINHKADELFRRYTRDAEQCPDLEIPNRATLRALALVELIRTAVGVEPGSGSAPRAEVTLVLHDHEATDTDGEPLPQADVDVWGCDPEVWAVVVDHMGIPVDVGHTHRLATIAQRRAITIRDGGCTFPGCDAPINWCDMHHIHDWHLGGPTDQANLVALCRHHHGVTHSTGWSMRLDDRQIPHWTSPSGHTLTGQRHHRRCPSPRVDPDPTDPMPSAVGPDGHGGALTRNGDCATIEHTFVSTCTLEPPP